MFLPLAICSCYQPLIAMAKTATCQDPISSMPTVSHATSTTAQMTVKMVLYVSKARMTLQVVPAPPSGMMPHGTSTGIMTNASKTVRKTQDQTAVATQAIGMNNLSPTSYAVTPSSASSREDMGHVFLT